MVDTFWRENESRPCSDENSKQPHFSAALAQWNIISRKTIHRDSNCQKHVTSKKIPKAFSIFIMLPEKRKPSLFYPFLAEDWEPPRSYIRSDNIYSTIFCSASSFGRYLLRQIRPVRPAFRLEANGKLWANYLKAAVNTLFIIYFIII